MHWGAKRKIVTTEQSTINELTAENLSLDNVRIREETKKIKLQMDLLLEQKNALISVKEMADAAKRLVIPTFQPVHPEVPYAEISYHWRNEQGPLTRGIEGSVLVSSINWSSYLCHIILVGFFTTSVWFEFVRNDFSGMGPYLQKCLDVFHEILDKKSQENPEGFDIDPVVRGYTIDVTCITGFGTEVSAQTDPNNPFNRHAKVALTFKPATSPMFLLYVFFPDVVGAFPKLFPMDFVPKDSLDFFIDASKSFIDERKKGHSKYKDLLQLMVNAHQDDEDDKTPNENRTQGLTDTEVIANSIMFMLAGFDTTASSIAWVLYDLALNPDVQEKLIEAIDEEIGENKLSYDNVFNMRYMDMVMSETLRIHPPAQRLNREASEDIEIKGLKIQKGMDCTYCPTILHFVEEYWDEPNKFNPERYRCPLRRHLAASTNLRSQFTCDWKEGSDVNPEISNMMKKRRAE
ncbi:CP3AV-like protein [Mya arenaria]|uniref:CP3AV-like protein n=1 Tax=Mya arenaria TaxID=6604 RepID=A0ABY7D9A3_MYAAR|nr:CP3AV-like protein [Mya arenaria]